ncbi:MAG TPA: Rrf2 family transcriptional regulator [Longimicrobiales bacterium]|nr:Rrf2 family transcriptional regulator [Longimicrobiales bacterium]
MLSQTAQYALRAIILLGEREGSGPVRVDEVARELDIPRNYLSKILHTLVKRGILGSLRGPRGGFYLARDAGSVTLLEVVEPFDDIEARRTCLLGKKECSDGNPCAVHEQWKATATEVARFYRETTLRSAVEEAERLGTVTGR